MVGEDCGGADEVGWNAKSVERDASFPLKNSSYLKNQNPHFSQKPGEMGHPSLGMYEFVARGGFLEVGMLRLCRSYASLHSGCAQHDIALGW